MRIGVMVGPDRGDTARKIARMLDDIAWAEAAGLASAWIPQIPGDMDALQCVTLLAARTTRIELGTAVVPLQAQHPVALARQALSAQAIAGGRLTLGVGPSHHWIVTDMLGLSYAKPAAYTRGYLAVLEAAWGATAAGLGRCVGDLLAAGDEAAIAARFQRFADAGVTDLSIQLFPVGSGRDEFIASKHRIRELLAALVADFA